MNGGFQVGPFQLNYQQVVVEVEVVRRGGGNKKRQLPVYWWEAKYKELREIPLPRDPKSNEVTQEVLEELQKIWVDLASRDIKFDLALAELDRLLIAAATYIEELKVTQLLQETRQRVQAAKDAKIAKEEQEIVELMILM